MITDLVLVLMPAFSVRCLLVAVPHRWRCSKNNYEQVISSISPHHCQVVDSLDYEARRADWLMTSISVGNFVIFKSASPLVTSTSSQKFRFTNSSPYPTSPSPVPYTTGHDMISINSRFLNIHKSV